MRRKCILCRRKKRTFGITEEIFGKLVAQTKPRDQPLSSRPKSPGRDMVGSSLPFDDGTHGTLDRHQIVPRRRRKIHCDASAIRTISICTRPIGPITACRTKKCLGVLTELVATSGKDTCHLAASNETSWGVMKSLWAADETQWLRSLRDGAEQLQHHQPTLRERTRTGLSQGTSLSAPLLTSRRRRAHWQLS